MKDYKQRLEDLLIGWTFKFSLHQKLSRRIDVFFEDCIQRDFMIFHKDNPHIYPTLVKIGREEKKHGAKFCSMKFVFCVARQRLSYDETFNSEGHKLKLSDRWSSRYSRLIMNNEPDLADFFNTHKLRKHYTHSKSFEESRQQYKDRSTAWQHSVERGDG